MPPLPAVRRRGRCDDGAPGGGLQSRWVPRQAPSEVKPWMPRLRSATSRGGVGWRRTAGLTLWLIEQAVGHGRARRDQDCKLTTGAKGPPIQTFLPYADFDRCAVVLDNMRLGKQRVETLQIMQVLLGLRWNNTVGQIESFVPRGWRTHPAVLMWREYEASLAAYQDATCREWTSRGFSDTCRRKTNGLLVAAHGNEPPVLQTPPWLGDEALHRSHQSNLVRKDPDIYAPAFPGVPPDLPYVWPTGV